MSTKRALIIGIAGQDGSYLAELLVEKGYQVFGLVRGAPEGSYDRLAAVRDQVELFQGDLLDQSSLESILRRTRPNEVYNLAAQSFVPASWEQPVLSAEFTAVGVTRLLEAMRATDPKVRFYQASSSEMFGAACEAPQNEGTPFRPRSPYGAAKVFGYFLTANYRERYGMYAASGILFNHESPRRGLEFVTRKVTDGVAQIKAGKRSELRMGSLEGRRDWGFAGDYVRAMWLMLQQDEPHDFVIATGTLRTVRDIVETAFAHAGLDWHEHVVTDERYVRPPETSVLVGDASRAREQLGWTPTVGFEDMIRMMVDSDLGRHLD